MWNHSSAMYLQVLLLFLCCCDVMSQTTTASPPDYVKQLKDVTSRLSRQLMMQQYYVEEAARSEGDSGIKQVRVRQTGPKSYYSASHTDHSAVSIHDHSDHPNTLGMAEFVAVLNGVEFMTRHNDYKLRMPSTSSSDYGAMEDIPFPDVPPQVLEKETVDEQIVEMREWFKAWNKENKTVRDYTKYFKNVLCYLEGAWTTNVDNLTESFESDRHFLDASNWLELQEKIRFMSYTGQKGRRENLAYLPTTIFNVTEDGMPVFAQWNYRILCHPLRHQFKLSNLVPVDNLAWRLAVGATLEDYVKTRAARFSVKQEKQKMYSDLDRMMYEIPGQDNYNSSDQLRDTSFGLEKVDVLEENPLKAGFYHCLYRSLLKDSGGEQKVNLGFSDSSLWVAHNTRPQVAPVSIQDCQGAQRRSNCSWLVKRVSYAIPMEILTLTPLHSWNPYNVAYHGKFTNKGNNPAREGGRRGGLTPETAFNGTDNKANYHTPDELFSGKKVNKKNADTTRNCVGVLDQVIPFFSVCELKDWDVYVGPCVTGTVCKMRSSGIRIFLPHMHGIGVLRTRYPIYPVYVEGSPEWKELEALRDVVMDLKKHVRYLYEVPIYAANAWSAEDSGLQPDDIRMVLETSYSNPSEDGSLHKHIVKLTMRQFFLVVRRNETLTTDTSFKMGHSHNIMVDYDETSRKFRIVECDHQPACSDGHTNQLTESATQ